MYKIMIFLIFLLALTLLFLAFRRIRAIRKIRKMSALDKVCQLNQLLYPFGFQYILTQDIFTSCLDAWQRDYGYCSLFDDSATFLNMVFDCEPIYFDYDNRTWLLEFWKGQYGINIGTEIGIYRAGRLLDPEEYASAIFGTIPDTQMPEFSLLLMEHNCPVCQICRKHWWLTAFFMGHSAHPEDLTVQFHISFPNREMCQAFLCGLINSGYSKDAVSGSDFHVCFLFDRPFAPQPRIRFKLSAQWAMFKNQCFLRMFHFFTRPFVFTMDKLLYLYAFAPFAFRHMAHIARRKKRRM